MQGITSSQSQSVAAADVSDAAVGSLVVQLRARSDQLSQKCDLYQQEVNRLNGKLERFVREVRSTVSSDNLQSVLLVSFQTLPWRTWFDLALPVK